jgi:hypothetical protein
VSDETFYEKVLLAWLLATRKSQRKSDAVKTLTSMFGGGRDATRKNVETAILGLRNKRHLVPGKSLALSEQGRQAALQFLTLPALPAKPSWKWIKQAIVLLAFGLEVTPARVTNAGQTGWMAAQLLARAHDIPLRVDLKLKEVVGKLQERALAKLCMESLKAPATQGPKGIPFLQPTPVDLATFAQHVNEAALMSSTGRWLDNNVFISHVYEELKRRRQVDDKPPEEFKRRLVEAHHARLVRLNRADLVDALPQEDVCSSQTDDGGNTFHFVRIDYLEREAHQGHQHRQGRQRSQ